VPLNYMHPRCRSAKQFNKVAEHITLNKKVK